MKKTITAAAPALLLAATRAKAIPVLDQESDGTPVGNGGSRWGTGFGRAQTFTVGVDGVLSTITFLVA